MLNVDVVHLRLGRHLQKPCNICVADFFDTTLIGTDFQNVLRCLRDNGIITADCTIIPTSATVCLAALDTRTPSPAGINMSPFDSVQRDSSMLQSLQLDDFPYTKLSETSEVLYISFREPDRVRVFWLDCGLKNQF